MTAYVKFEVGQVWESRDWRDSGRRVRIVEVDSKMRRINVRNTITNRLSRVALRNFRDEYKYVEGP